MKWHKFIWQNPLFRLIVCNMISPLSRVPIYTQCANLTLFFPIFALNSTFLQMKDNQTSNSILALIQTKLLKKIFIQVHLKTSV